uniref:alcohol dehydrogenase catalytic domain-containing protein n=1 Tax=Frankia sp. AiPa1 TaxID=573492 RepID=UPI00202AFD4D|nr:alcohol dehydrogenase catalytic domain-containing protein [Frankia sp. AiPa1]MCL9762723.1 alcohol dehydrogenase catalytic domain-containing protein [Frankia sp. AiPa1]
MRAARLSGARTIQIEDVPAPVMSEEHLLLRPRFTGLCGTDLHLWHGGPPAGEPLVLGHEFSAEIVEVGSAVTDPTLRPGVLVAVEPLWNCGTCAPCRRGDYNLCRALAFHGLAADHSGGLGELTVVRPRMAHVLPPDLSSLQGALVEPISVAHHAVGRAGVAPGDAAVVLGAGPVGIACVLDLVARGIRRIIVSEPSPLRRGAVVDALTAVGATESAVVLDPGAADLGEAARELTDGEGVDAVLDAAGVEVAFQAALGVVRPGGRIVTVATYLQPVSLHPLLTMLSEIDLRASLAYQDDFPPVIELMAKGHFPTDAWVSTISLAEVSAAFEHLDAGNGNKILVDLASA